MFKKAIFLLIFILISLGTSISPVRATPECVPGNPDPCGAGFSCQPSGEVAGKYLCREDTVGKVFGKITPPDSLKKFNGTDQTGAQGISSFLTNLIALIYGIAMVVFVLMIVWGAFDWMTSEGNKEKIESARSKILNALIGIILFAAAFAIIQLLGVFTGFSLFVGQQTGT